jgi:hypothetical protein
MNATIPTRAMPAKRRQMPRLLKRIINYAVLALAFFLLGFLPLWVGSREASLQHAETARQLRLVQLQAALGSAVIDAQRGQHEQALGSVSSFFSSLQAAIDSGEASDFSAAQREALQPLLAGRDELIALLARGDAASAGELAALYQSFSQILTGQVAPPVEA